VLEIAKTHVTDLEKHIKQGETLIEAKDTSLEEIEKKLNSSSQADIGQAKLIKSSIRDK
jgi:hypothetical protein